MMKKAAFLILCFFMLAGCSTYNHIQISEENGLKMMHLIQSPAARTLYEKDDLNENSRLKINVHYLYQQKDKVRPIINLYFKTDRPGYDLPESMITIGLGEEDIQLFSSEGHYPIPENLWVPIVHSQNIHYKLKKDDNEVVISLNEKEKQRLIEFFNRAIKLRDTIFPAIPEGQKKW